MKRKLLLSVLLVAFTIVFSLGIAACEAETHTHSFSSAWSHDETFHWNACNGCNEVQNKTLHSFDDKNECTVCHYTKPDANESIHAHKLTHTNESSATCTNAGNIEYWYCTECQKYFRDAQCEFEIQAEDTVIDPEHSYVDWEITVEVTCEHDGERVAHCEFCGQPTTEILPKYDHEYVWRQTEISHWQVCKNGCSYKSEKEDHEWDTNNHCAKCNYDLPFSKGLSYKEITDDSGNIVAYSVAKGNCSDRNVILPAFYNKLPVTTVQRAAFKDDDKLNSVTITSNITTIYAGAFSNCTSLKEVTIGSNVITLASQVFANCSSLETVYWYAENCYDYFTNSFSGCGKITSVIIGDNVKYFPRVLNDFTALNFTEEDDGLYLGNADNPYVLFYKAISKEIKSFAVRNETHLIYDEAFRDCTQLVSISETENLYSIGSYAFYNCSELQAIELGQNMYSIGSYAFYNCTALTSIALSDHITEIAPYTFYN